MTQRIYLSGTKEIARRLKALDTDLRKKAVDPAMRAGMRIYVDEAKARAPVRTGAMRDSIKARKDGKGSTRGSTSYLAGVTVKAFYYYFIEFGTSKLAARPFLRPAWEAVSGKVIAEALGVVRKKLRLK